MPSVLLIGLDGATFTVLDRLMADGEMPRLAALRASGAHAPLLSTPHPLTPPAWTTVMTGRSPGEHGIFDFLRADFRNGRVFTTLNDFRHIRRETLWTIANRLGCRVTALNFPLTAPPPSVAGSVVPGLLSWRHLRRNVHPPDLYDEIAALPGFSAKEMSWDFESETSVQNMTEAELEPWVRFHIVRERRWFDITAHLMDHDRSDFRAVMFDGADKLQHACWRFLDPALVPARPDPTEARLRELCLEYFRQLDGFVGALVEKAGPGARTFVVSDHGFGPSRWSFRVNKWLEGRGHLRWPAGPSRRPARNTHFAHLDWARTVAYAPSAATNGVHIRVKRSPDEAGVAPEEYAAFRARLVADLREVRTPDTGERLFKDILTREDAFPGEFSAGAPDLTLVPIDHGMISVLDLDPVVAVRPTVTGVHYPEGILFAHGPGVVRGARLPTQSILDVAPTLLYGLDRPVPEDFEGRVIGGLFDPAHRAGHPVRFGPPTEPPDAPGGAGRGETAAVEAGEEEVVLNRLRALGYVE